MIPRINTELKNISFTNPNNYISLNYHNTNNNNNIIKYTSHLYKNLYIYIVRFIYLRLICKSIF